MRPMDLRPVPTEWLERELRRRRGCIDCRTQYARRWYPAGFEIARCSRCAAAHRLKAWKLRRAV
jgi:hypothetical protein